MKLLLILSFLLLAKENYSQVLKHYNNVKKINLTKDSICSIKYYNGVESEILTKIDSFNTHLSANNFEIDSNYFFVVEFKERFNKLNAIIYYRSGYCDYLLITKTYPQDKVEQIPFAFSFYKKSLILFCTYKKGLKLSPESSSLVSNLIYENVNTSVKREIDKKVNSYVVQSKPLKTYILK